VIAEKKCPNYMKRLVLEGMSQSSLAFMSRKPWIRQFILKIEEAMTEQKLKGVNDR
jgi:hypothetical protein